MLMMSRREGEAILIGDDIEVVIAHIGRSRVKVGIRAPRTTAILAREVRLVRDENRAAANLGSRLDRLGVAAQIFSRRADEGIDRQDAGHKN